MVVGAAVVAVIVAAAWFPATALFHQHQQLASSTAQLTELQKQDKALDQERKSLASPAEIARIARQQYGLVKPGQQSYEVLPPSQTGTGSGTDAPEPGDPGSTAPVTPSGESELPAGSTRPTSGTGGSSTSEAAATGTATTGSAGSSTGGPSGGSATGTGAGAGADGQGSSASASVGGRILQTLEFWR
ncbi:MAG TPA: septum formation initiator family protein [Acidimicrobiales bacterium]|nr:septum formation initiator family protein [Acidimicrobiales bacterium]